MMRPLEKHLARGQIVRLSSATAMAVICRGLLLLLSMLAATAESYEHRAIQKEGTLSAVEGTVHAQQGSNAISAAVVPSPLVYGQKIWTERFSTAAGIFEDNASFRLRERTIMEIERATGAPGRIGIGIRRGTVQFSHRQGPKTVEVSTQDAVALNRGTEYIISSDPEAHVTRIMMFDGEVTILRGGESTTLRSREYAEIRPGKPIIPKPLLQATNLVQWWLYYPAVASVSDIAFSASDRLRLAQSIAAYERGNLRAALEAFPGFPDHLNPASREEGVFLAALLLSNNAVEEAQELLDARPEASATERALRLLIQAVRRPSNPKDSDQPVFTTGRRSLTASEWLAESYWQQAVQHKSDGLVQALESARHAAALTPDFGYAWARIAELEFSLGSAQKAAAAIEHAFALAPENAHALALRGFIFAARNRIDDALRAFDEAIVRDPKLGDGWLGRGLCRIRRGERASGIEDLQTAAAMEPGRSLTRSYAGKAFTLMGASKVGHEELEFAKLLDPLDPTPWLYSGWIAGEENRINQAIADVEHSVSLNDNRQVYRSQLLLDQDRSMRRANLARLYQDAGFTNLSTVTAIQAVNSDYANSSAHLFLANSYNALRDLNQVNLRYETPWQSEFLLAQLLAPPGGAPLSQTVSQNEYSKLFTADGLGFANETQWSSHGDWWQAASQHGQYGGFEYAVDGIYRSKTGLWANGGLEQSVITGHFKQQVTPEDRVLFETTASELTGGDLLPHYDSANANPQISVRERLEPFALAGWDHAWGPGAHTLFLLSPWNTSQSVDDPLNHVPIFYSKQPGDYVVSKNVLAPLRYESEFRGISLELQHLWQVQGHRFIAGCRYQMGDFKTSEQLDLGPAQLELARQEAQVDPGFQRVGVYAYDLWQCGSILQLTAGAGYDVLKEPSNFRFAPVVSGTDRKDMFSPKLGFSLTPRDGSVFRGAWTRSLGGVSFDQSVRLEPVQVAGFTQAYRSLIPESLAGAVSGQEFETLGLAWDQSLPTKTWFTFSLEELRSRAEQDAGALEYSFDRLTTQPLSVRQGYAFSERSFAASAGQLIDPEFSLSASYRLSQSELNFTLPGGIDSSSAGFGDSGRATLHQLSMGPRWNSRLGFFAGWESVWTHQINRILDIDQPGDNYWQHNLQLGYRFFKRHGEISVGLLNLTDRDYHLFPLSYYSETYRGRTIVLSGRFSL